jgi:hypothetical protein
MSSEQILAIAGVVLSLAFEYIPGLHAWYNALTDDRQRGVMLLALALTVAGAFGLSCVGWLQLYVCDQAGVQRAVIGFIAALAANQAMHRILPKGGA